MNEIRILVVDDEQAVRQLLKQFFEELGYIVHTAADGESALEEFADFSPHFVFLDVIMPDINGIDVLCRMKELDRQAQIVMISGMHDLTMAKEAINAGAADYITKPIEFRFLQNYIRTEVKKLFGTSNEALPGV